MRNLLPGEGAALAKGALLAVAVLAAAAVVFFWSSPTAPTSIADRPTADARVEEPLEVAHVAVLAAAAPMRETIEPRLPPNADEGILEADFRRVVNGRMSLFQSCYDRSMQDTVARPGRMTFRITIGPSGLVSEAQRVASTFEDPELDRCVTTTVRAMRFPSPGAGAMSLTFPIVFQPGG